MEHSEFVDEWRRRRLCALVFGMWKNNTMRGYDVELDSSKIKAEKFYLNRKHISFFSRIEGRLACYARSYNNMLYVKYFVMLIAYRKGIHYWLEFVKHRYKTKEYSRVSNDKLFNSSFVSYPRNICKRFFFFFFSRRYTRSRYLMLMNKIIEKHTRNKQNYCFNALVENYNRCLLQSQSDTKGRVYYLESLFGRLIDRLGVGYTRGRREKKYLQIAISHKKQRESRIVFANLSRICCESIANKRVGNLLQIRYEKSILRKGLLSFIYNYSYRLDMKIYNRTYVNNCMVLYKKGVGMRIWKSFMKRRQKQDNYIDMCIDHSNRISSKRVFLSHWRHKCVLRRNTHTHTRHMDTSIHKHIIISNIRADCFHNKYLNSKSLSLLKNRCLEEKRRELISTCRSIIFWKLWRYKVALCRRWKEYVNIRKFKRDRLRHAKAKHKSMLIKNSCRAIVMHHDQKLVKKFSPFGNKKQNQNQNPNIMKIVRTAALHWLSITRKNRRLRNILSKCSVHMGDEHLKQSGVEYQYPLQTYSHMMKGKHEYDNSYSTKHSVWSSPTSVMDSEVKAVVDNNKRSSTSTMSSSNSRGYNHHCSDANIPSFQSFNVFEAPRGLPPPLTEIARDLGSGLHSNNCNVRHGSPLLVPSHSDLGSDSSRHLAPTATSTSAIPISTSSDAYEKKLLVLEYISLLEATISMKDNTNSNRNSQELPVDGSRHQIESLDNSRDEMMKELNTLLQYVTTLE